MTNTATPTATPGLLRYGDNIEADGLRVSLTFNGPAEAYKDAQFSSQACVAAFSQRSQTQIWRVDLGDIAVVPEPWNEFKLVEILNGRVFAAIATTVAEFDRETGEILWRTSTGNSIVCKVLANHGGESLIIYNDWYKHSASGSNGNICCLSLTGTELWRAQLPSAPDANDAFVSVQWHDGKLFAFTYGCDRCILDNETGEVLKAEFTK